MEKKYRTKIVMLDDSIKSIITNHIPAVYAAKWAKTKRANLEEFEVDGLTFKMKEFKGFICTAPEEALIKE